MGKITKNELSESLIREINANSSVSSVNDQTGDVTIIVPTKTSELTNDSDFVTTQNINNIENKIKILTDEGFLNSYATDADVNGYYTVVTFKRNNSTIYLVSTLSNPDTNGYYQTCTWDFYDIDGTTITSTKTWTFTYDTNGKRVTKEVV